MKKYAIMKSTLLKHINMNTSLCVYGEDKAIWHTMM